MIWFFGIGIPEWLFATLVIAGTIFYAFTIWLLLQILRRKMPTRVLKAELGQSLEEYRAKEDDVKIYWNEGFFGKLHECIKTTKERIRTHWGVPNKVYLVRRDFNLTIPFVRKITTSLLKMFHLTDEDIKLVKEYEKKKDPFPVQKLSKQARLQISILDTKPLDLCNDCQKNVPEYVTVDFVGTDELKGSSTEATDQRRNEDFCDSAIRSYKKQKRGDWLSTFLFGCCAGAIICLTIVFATGIIKLG